jgi:di/tricarboxylate transporter
MMGSDASPFALLSVFVAAILILTNFVSHTVASITMMPVVVEVVRCSLGKSVGQCAPARWFPPPLLSNHPPPSPPPPPPIASPLATGPYVLPCVLATRCSCPLPQCVFVTLVSAACVLPVSSFPNIFTSSVQLADGRLVLP